MNTIFPAASVLHPNAFRSSGTCFGCLIELPAIGEKVDCVSEAVRCPTCGCLIDPASVCLVCDPKSFHEMTAQGRITNTFAVGQARKSERSTIHLAIDLAIPEATLLQMIDTFSSTDFMSTFKDFLFSAAFLAEAPMYVTRKGSILNICFGDFFDENETSFSPEVFGSVLKDAFRMMKLMVRAKTSGSAFLRLFEEMSHLDLLHMFVFCATKLEVPQSETRFGVTFIEFGPKADTMPNNILLPFSFGWGHCIAISWDHEMTKYLYKRVSGPKSKTLTIKMAVSSGFEILWAGEVRKESYGKANRVNITLPNYTADIAVAVILQGSQKYSHETHFGLHVEYNFYNGQTIVANKAWEKATTMEEWQDSFNIINLCAVGMKQHALHALLAACNGKQPSFNKKGVWNISNLRTGGPVNFAKLAFSVFKALILDDNSMLPLAVRRELLFHIARGNTSYLGAVAGRLIDLRVMGDEIRIPPFVITCRPVEVRQEPPFDTFGVNVVLSEEHFRKLQQQIRTIFAKSDGSTRK